ncbi:hypothetical protein [Bradyrhizobium sp. CCBAU 51745]|uniref:hypothetical protein n=1 Tax=Bradyrhizobium sp. CCBAU 51745 TaxID=1325099 RepID=UPI00230510DA|nr:hypothetical protein [Bradyrhizobium sp. CCBAU 51745]
MTNVYFHYFNARGVLLDRSHAFVDDLIDACEQADHDGECGRLAQLGALRQIMTVT